MDGKWWRSISWGRRGIVITDTIPIAVIDEEKEKALKTEYITLYTKLFYESGVYISKMRYRKKIEKLLYNDKQDENAVQKIRDARGFALKFQESLIKTCAFGALKKGTVVSASERRGGAR